MKTITKFKSMRRSRTFLLSIVCAGAVATLLGGCAERMGPPRATTTTTAISNPYYGSGQTYYGPRYYNHGDQY